MRTPDFAGYLEPIARTKSSNIEVFKDFTRMGACALAAWTREPEYLEIAKRYNKEELQEICKAFGSLIGQMENEPFEDLLGSYYQDAASKSTRDNRGEFFTPPCISELMAKIGFNAEKVIAEGKPVSVSEPTCWSGGMVLQIAKQLSPVVTWKKESHVDLLRATMQDISPVAVDMSYINMTSWGIPAHLIHGNTLSMEIWDQWKNMHWHRVWEDARLKTKQILEFLKDPGSTHTQQEVVSIGVDPQEIKTKETESGQFEFDL